MAEQWRKIGLVFRLESRPPWMISHASLPTPVHLEADLFRVFFSARNAEKRSSIGWADVRIGERPDVVRVADRPVLTPGCDGTFDDDGIGIGSIVTAGDGRHRLYYMGWNVGRRAPWRNSIGLAVGDAAVPAFERFSEGPLLDRSPADPFTLSYPWVLPDRQGGWRMWYGSNLTWGADKADMSHAIKHARSDDGLVWNRDGRAILAPQGGDEFALARPCVQPADSGYDMWFAHRGDRYRIGYARSLDGLSWQRHNLSSLAPSAEGWDSEMVCYPYVFPFQERIWMLFNGNGYGETGFGLAVAD